MESQKELSLPNVDEEPAIQVEPDLTIDETCELISFHSEWDDFSIEPTTVDKLQCHRRSDSAHREWLQTHFDVQ